MKTATEALEAALERFPDPDRLELRRKIIAGYNDAYRLSSPENNDPAYLEGFHIGYVEGEMK